MHSKELLEMRGAGFARDGFGGTAWGLPKRAPRAGGPSADRRWSVATARPDPRVMLLDVLLATIEEDPYPSTSMLDMVESLLRPHELPVYVAFLLDRIERETFPNIPMLRRLHELVQ
jgi:hypothetical protein